MIAEGASVPIQLCFKTLCDHPASVKSQKYMEYRGLRETSRLIAVARSHGYKKKKIVETQR